MELKPEYDPKIFSIIKNHLILHFRSKMDCAAMLKGSPWFVARQLLAMEAWESHFMLD